MCSNQANPLPSHATAEVSAEAPIVSVQARPGYQPPAARRAELILGRTGPFRPLIEEYTATLAPLRYKPEALVQVRGNIAKFFRFVVQDQHLEHLDQIRPSTITQFINAQRDLGHTSFVFLGHLATFFVWLISEEVYDRGNPVINRLHRRQMMFGPHSFTPTP